MLPFWALYCETNVSYSGYRNLPRSQRLLPYLIILIGVLSVYAENVEASNKKIPLISILSPRNDPECRFAARSIKRQMRDLGYKKHKTIRYRTRRCEVTPAAVKKQVRRAIEKGATVIVSFTEPVTRYAIEEAGGSVPILFCMPKDQASSVIDRGEGIPLTGVFIQRASSADVLCLTRLLVPGLKSLGVLNITGGDTSWMEGLSGSAGDAGISVISVGVNDGTHTKKGGVSEKVDTLLITNRNSDAAFSKEVATAYVAAGIPVFSVENIFPGSGVLACITMEPGEREGRQLGVLLDRLLKGESCKDVRPVEMRGKLSLSVDLSTAERLGIKFAIPPSSLEMKE